MIISGFQNPLAKILMGHMHCMPTILINVTTADFITVLKNRRAALHFLQGVQN